MIEKVIDHIDELEQPHLKLMVMHDFMWALIEELASNRARAHQARTRTLDVIYGLWILRSMTSPRALSTGPFDPGQPQRFANT